MCAYLASNETPGHRENSVSWCLCNDTAWRVVAGPQRPPTCGGGLRPLPYPRAAAPYLLQARPECAYPAPNETLRLRGSVIDCCLRNGAAWCVVAGPQRPSTCGGGLRPLPLRRRIHIKPAPMCTCPAPNKTLRLHEGVIDCCLCNGAAWRVVAGPPRPPTRGGGRRPPPPYIQVRASLSAMAGETSVSTATGKLLRAS
jgi:hypothetical protein